MNIGFWFKWGLVFKGIDAVLEVIGGILLLMPVEVDRTIAYLSQHELWAEPRHPTTAHLEHAVAAALARATIIGAVYLMVHGLAKVTLILGIYKNQKWGYKGLIGVLSFFAVLEFVRGFTALSIFALAFAVFDLLIVYVIAKEYRIKFAGPSEG